MEWRKIRREKLAKSVEIEKAEAERKQPRSSKSIYERWERFTSSTDMVRLGIIGGVIILPILGWVLFTMVSGGSANDEDPGVVADTYPTAVRTPGTATPAATPTTIPTERPTPRPGDTPEPNRQDCDEIAGSSYQSDAEREWFTANCGALAAVPPPEPPASEPHEEDEEAEPPSPPPSRPPTPRPPNRPPPPPPPPPPPTQQPSGPQWTSGRASNAAKNWIVNVAHLADWAGPCSASWSSNRWMVNCSSSSGSMRVCILEQQHIYYQC
jgi:hypothetical protein